MRSDVYILPFHVMTMLKLWIKILSKCQCKICWLYKILYYPGAIFYKGELKITQVFLYFSLVNIETFFTIFFSLRLVEVRTKFYLSSVIYSPNKFYFTYKNYWLLSFSFACLYPKELKLQFVANRVKIFTMIGRIR